MPEFFRCNFEKSGVLDQSRHAQNLADAFAILKPVASPFPLILIGPRGDGGYLVPDDLGGIAACFLPGVNNTKDFEDHLSTAFGMRAHMCDFSSDAAALRTPLIDGLQTFRKLWLDIGGAAHSISLTDWVAQQAGAGDLLLQMDIEGAEYRNILSCPTETLSRFRIIVIELHELQNLNDPDIVQQVLLPFLTRIGETHGCVHAHPNNCCGEAAIAEIGATVPRVLELTFLRKDRFAAPSACPPIAPMLPHPSDISRNVRAHPPLFLGEAWFAGERKLTSRLKMVEHELAYQRDVQTSFPHLVNQHVEAALRLTARASSALLQLHSAGLARAPEGLQEAAVGRSFVLSSCLRQFTPGFVVPERPSDFFFHTAFDVNQSITVDLGALRKVGRVAIGNRRDACFDRARLLFLILHTDETHEQGQVFGIDPPPGFLSGGGEEARIDLPGVAARYVTVLSPLHTALHFSSLRVFVLPDGGPAA